MRLALIFACVIVAVSACNQPLVKPTPTQGQHKATSSSHWEVIAKSRLDQLIPAMTAKMETDPSGHMLNGESGSVRKFIQRPIYVSSPASDMPFARAFKAYLEEALIEEGYSVVRRPERALVINFDVDTFYYGPRESRRFPADYATFWSTPAGIALIAADDASIGLAGSGALLLGLGPLLDILVEMGAVTNAEALLSLSVVDDYEVLYRDVEAFYIPPADLPLYWTRYPDRPDRLTGPLVEEPLPVREVRFVNE